MSAPSLIGVVVVAFALGSMPGCGGSGAHSRSPSSTKETAGIRAAESLLAGIPQAGAALGSPRAPVTVQFFGDVACANTREFTQQGFAQIIRRWVRPGRLRIVFRSLQEGTESEESFAHLQLAALAAARQNKLWSYLETFFAIQAALGQNEADSCNTSVSLAGKAAPAVAGLEVSRWLADQHDEGLAHSLVTDRRAANAAGLEGTPSFLLSHTGARPVVKVALTINQHSLVDPRPLSWTIERLLRHRSPVESGLGARMRVAPAEVPTDIS